MNFSPAMSARDLEAIEVEVIEVDGVAPAKMPEMEKQVPQPKLQEWAARVHRLDRRWWPLWLFLGFIVAVLALTLGLIVAAVVLVVRVFQQIFRRITA